MAEEVISVTGIAEMGVVKDSPPIALAPNVFTDVKNVRFRDGAVTKISGEVLLNNITEDTFRNPFITFSRFTDIHSLQI